MTKNHQDYILTSANNVTNIEESKKIIKFTSNIEPSFNYC